MPIHARIRVHNRRLELTLAEPVHGGCLGYSRCSKAGMSSTGTLPSNGLKQTAAWNYELRTMTKHAAQEDRTEAAARG